MNNSMFIFKSLIKSQKLPKQENMDQLTSSLPEVESRLQQIIGSVLLLLKKGNIRLLSLIVVIFFLYLEKMFSLSFL